MSEAERRRRLNYKRNRKKWIFAGTVALLTVTLLMAIFSFTYYQLDKTFFIEYTEQGDVDYEVELKPNSFYDELTRPSGETYVSTLIDKVNADFTYEMQMAADKVDFNYSYYIIAELKILDKDGQQIFSPKYELKPEQSLNVKGNTFSINETVSVDYATYNDLAKSFNDTYGLANVTSVLALTMVVDVVGSSDSFEENTENLYRVALEVPLTKNTTSIQMSSSVPTGANKVLAVKDAVNGEIFKTLAVIALFIDLFLALVLVAFVFMTRNHDVNYSIKVQKIVSSYRSYIQKILGGFDTRGYQVLTVGSFVEMLGIRDTIQQPILMSENTDQTRAQFFIPTNTKILYLFEIKVDNYNELYGSHPEWKDDSVITTETVDKLVDEATNSVVEAATGKVIDSATDKVIDSATERIVEEATERILRESKDKLGDAVISDVTPKLVESVIKETTPRVVEDAVRVTTPRVTDNVLSKADEHLKSITPTEPAKSTTVIEIPEPAYDKTADLIAAKLLARLAEAEATRETPAPIVNVSVNPVIEREVERVVEVPTAPIEESEPEEELFEVGEPEQLDFLTLATPLKEAEPAEPVKAEESEPEVIEEPEAVEETEPEVIEEPEEVEPIAVPLPEEEPISVEMPIELIEEPAEPTELVLESDDDDDDAAEFYYDENGNKLDIRISRSFLANVIQSDATVKAYYSELKNYILSYKGAKARIAWRYETFKKGRYQLFRIKLRGRTLCLYCALDPAEFDPAKYFHEACDKKMFENVPMLVRIRSDRGFRKALELVDITMAKFEMKPDKKFVAVDYAKEHPFEKTQALIDRGLIKLLSNDFTPTERPEPEEPEAPEEPAITEEQIEEAMNTPDVNLEEVDYVDEPVEEYTETVDHPGVEVIGVVWNEREKGNKIYRYDPNGEVVHDGDVVLVPTKAREKEIVRKAAVAHGNHKVDPESVKHPLKKIISVVKRKVEDILSGD